MDFVSIVLPLIAGVIIGGIAGYLFTRFRNRDSEYKIKLEKLQSELDEYQLSVRSHFIDTVSLLGQIDQRQKELHRAVADGVIRLCESEGSDNDYLLEQSVRALSLSQLDEDDEVKRDK